MSYCEYCILETSNEVHKEYHDRHYGFPVKDDDELFGRLILEINQAGLSWDLILKKEQNFRRAYDEFNLKKIAAYTEKDRLRLLSDSGIIRNKLKINAAIYNAKQILHIQQEFGSFSKWLDKYHPLTCDEWTKLFKKSFKFVGREIVNEFLISTGYLPGAHDESCTVFEEIKKLKPKWIEL